MKTPPSLGNTLDDIWRAWRDARPRTSCQTVVGRIVCGGGTYDFREGRLNRVYAPTPRSLATYREASEQEVEEVEEAITKGWLQITDEPVSGVQYGEGRPGFGTLVLHQATGRNLQTEGERDGGRQATHTSTGKRTTPVGVRGRIPGRMEVAALSPVPPREPMACQSRS